MYNVVHVLPHLAGLEIAENHHHPVLHLRLRDELDQAGDDSPDPVRKSVLKNNGGICSSCVLICCMPGGCVGLGGSDLRGCLT